MYSKLRPLRTSRVRFTSAAEQDIEASAACLSAQHLSGLTSQLGIEAGTQRQGGGQGGGRVTRSVPRIGDAQAGVRHQQAAAPPGGPRRGRTRRSSGVPSGIRGSRVGLMLFGAHDADQEREALLIGHLLFDLTRPLASAEPSTIGIARTIAQPPSPSAAGATEGGCEVLPSRHAELGVEVAVDGLRRRRRGGRAIAAAAEAARPTTSRSLVPCRLAARPARAREGWGLGITRRRRRAPRSCASPRRPRGKARRPERPRRLAARLGGKEEGAGALRRSAASSSSEPSPFTSPPPVWHENAATRSPSTTAAQLARRRRCGRWPRRTTS